MLVGSVRYVDSKVVGWLEESGTATFDRASGTMSTGGCRLSEAGFLTVRELVNEADLELEPLTGEVGLERGVAAVHHSDLTDPTPWMVDHTLLITHGNELAKTNAEGTRYLDRIAHKTAALVVGVGPHTALSHVSADIVKYAGSLEMPLFEVPYSYAFRTIFSYVYHALASTDMHRLRRMLALQNQLLSTLVEGDGIDNTLERLSKILGMSILLFDSSGEVVVAVLKDEAVDPIQVWRAQDASEGYGSTGVRHAHGGRVSYHRVAVGSSVERVLVGVTTGPPVTEFAEMALSYSKVLVALHLLGRREEALHRLQARSMLLQQFFACEADAQGYRQRFLDEGADLDLPWRVIIVGLKEPPAIHPHQPIHVDNRRSYEQRMAATRTVDRWFIDHRVPALCGEKGGLVVTVAVFGDAAVGVIRESMSELRDHLRQTFPRRRVDLGISGGRTGFFRPAALLRQALESLSIANSRGAEVRVPLFDEEGARFRLVEGQSSDALQALRDRLITPLMEYDHLHGTALLDTVRKFLENRLSSHETADALFVHRNTLHKRLKRVEELLGIQFGSIDDVMELYIALRAADYLIDSRNLSGEPVHPTHVRSSEDANDLQ